MKRPLVLLAGLLAGVLLSACGKKLPPQAPLQVIPARIEPLRVTQQGSDVVLRFPYPSVTATGETLTALSDVTVYRELLPAPKGAKPPEPPKGAERDRAERDFKARAQPVVTLDRNGLDEATTGGEILVRDSLYKVAEAGQLGRVFLRYGAVATRDRKHPSPMSPLVTIFPLVPPDQPIALSAMLEERRACISWQPPDRMLDGTSKTVVGAYAVYRRLEADEAYDEPLAVVSRGREYVDSSVEPGRRYVYTVRAAPGPDAPLVLGPPADELLVDTRDVFPPAPPEALLVLAEERDNRLVWNPVLASDLAGYRVYRRTAGRGWEKVGDVTAPTFVDAGAPAGTEYAVSAYDRSGNESAHATMKQDETEGQR